MSEGPELSGPEALAAEHALGVLSAAERRQAEWRMAWDRSFAASVAQWRERLQPLADDLEPVVPPERVWAAVMRALPANDNSLLRSVRFWRTATAASLTLAAASVALAIFVANRPPLVVQPQAAQLLNASLTSPAGGTIPLFVAAYDPTRKALIVTSLVQPGKDPAHVHELWVIPSDGKPRPLGFIEPGKTKALPMPRQLLPTLTAGSAIAVSVEPPGGSPKVDAPSGPIAAVGKLSKI